MEAISRASLVLLLGSASCTSTPLLCTDDVASTYENPGPLPSANGQVLKCGHDGSLSAAQVDSLARTTGYDGAALTSGASLLRLSYKTQRGTQPPTPGFSSALVLLPSQPRAAKLPVVVMAHGTMGEGPACPITQEPPTSSDSYLAELGYPLVGGGYAVILPDYAGYADFGAGGNPPSGYHAAADEAMSVLDAARALRSLQPDLFNGDTVLVGHSQGGHAVLSALAMHESYGSGGQLVGVVAYAPSWFPITTFGALLADPNDFPLPAQADTVAAMVWYHYSHAELLDGPGTGVQLFAADKRAQVQQFFDQVCDPNEAALTSVGMTSADIFDPSFVDDIALSASLGLPCPDARCTTWMARYLADRPHLTGPATQVPILFVYGTEDEWIPSDRETCAMDRLTSDGADVTFCIVPGADHDGSVEQRSDYANGWIGNLALGEPMPSTCGLTRAALTDGDGGVATCATPPPND